MALLLSAISLNKWHHLPANPPSSSSNTTTFTSSLLCLTALLPLHRPSLFNLLVPRPSLSNRRCFLKKSKVFISCCVIVHNADVGVNVAKFLLETSYMDLCMFLIHSSFPWITVLNNPYYYLCSSSIWNKPAFFWLAASKQKVLVFIHICEQLINTLLLCETL